FLLSCVVLVQMIGDPTPKEYWVNWAVFGDAGMSGAKQIGEVSKPSMASESPEIGTPVPTESHQAEPAEGEHHLS
ncbi:MAG TPA: hypothetical protein DEO84_01230, partial [candidate division Zixibacteria bacterium]|nr:hypothetical protein [candidate division Zixibacteria bacterium]